MTTFYDDVAEFQRKFGLPLPNGYALNGREPSLLKPAEFDYRLKFIQEELNEFFTCHEDGDLAGCADALVDLTYVVLGTALYMGLPFNELWADVQRANMAKRLQTADDPDHKRGKVEIIVKPLGWQPPQTQTILDRYENKGDKA